MPAHRFLFALSMLGAVVLVGGEARAQSDPSGLWLTEDGQSKIRIARCGGGFCGTVAWTAGKAQDSSNPDPSLRSRPVVGIRLLSTDKRTGDGFAGTLYNPRDGKTYEGTLKVAGPDKVVVSGCVMSVFCKGQTWTRTN